MAIRAAVKGPNMGSKISKSAASGRSTIRDQWTFSPLTAEPGLHLSEAQIVVGIAKREPIYLAPFIMDEIGAGAEEQQPEDRAPVALDPGHDFLFDDLVGTVPHADR